MSFKNFFLSSLCLWFPLAVMAQGPNNSGPYYQQANGQKSRALKTALSNIIAIDANDVESYDGLIKAYVKTDTRADGYVRDWYSNTTHFRHNTDKAGNYSKEGDCYNREHSIPQSWFNKASPMKSDIVHVIPTDGYVNNQRSSYPFGEVGSVTYQSNNGYSKLGSCKTSGYSGIVFEPNDEVKGDIARIYFYMATCYESRIIGWTNGTSNIQNDKYKPFPDWQMKMLMRWSAADPVDAVEKARNDSVFVVQGNRNPFVDYPGLEKMIWGDKQDVAFVYDNYESPSSGGDDSGGDDSGGGQGGGGGDDDPAVTPTQGENVYVKITSTSELEVGVAYLIVCESKDVAMGEPNSDGRSRTQVSVSISDEQITTATGESGKPYTLVLGGNSSQGYTLYDPVKKTYLAKIQSNNTLNEADEATSNQTRWTISFKNGNAEITNKQSTSYSIMYNTSASMFRAYPSGQTPVQLYKIHQSTGIDISTYIPTDKERVTVHSINGMLIRLTDNYPDALRDLPKGIYIINGRKIVIR